MLWCVWYGTRVATITVPGPGTIPVPYHSTTYLRNIIFHFYFFELVSRFLSTNWILKSFHSLLLYLVPSTWYPLPGTSACNCSWYCDSSSDHRGLPVRWFTNNLRPFCRPYITSLAVSRSLSLLYSQNISKKSIFLDEFQGGYRYVTILLGCENINMEKENRKQHSSTHTWPGWHSHSHLLKLS